MFSGAPPYANQSCCSEPDAPKPEAAKPDGAKPAEGEKKDDKKPPEKKDDYKDFDEVTKDAEKIEGLFTLYRKKEKPAEAHK